MPPLKSSLIKPSKSMLFFHIWNANFSVTPINSQMYMTKPKQVQKKLSENTGKTFSVIMPSFTCRGGGHNYGNYCTGDHSHQCHLHHHQQCHHHRYRLVNLCFLIFVAIIPITNTIICVNISKKKHSFRKPEGRDGLSQLTLGSFQVIKMQSVICNHQR